MKLPARPTDEPGRLEALRRYELLDTLPEPALDDLAALAAHICETPLALITVVGDDRQWVMARSGMSIGEASRDVSFCAHAILQPRLFVVRDATQDDRFADNPQVTGEPYIRFYAGAPLITSDGHAVGTICVIDRVPRELDSAQQEALAVLSRQVMTHLELRRQRQALLESETRPFEVCRHCPVGLAINRLSDRKFVDVNTAFSTITGWTHDQVIGRTAEELGMVEVETEAQLRSRLQQDGAFIGVDVALRAASGEIRHALMGTALAELNGEQHAITTFLDVTERKRTEMALRESEAEARLLTQRLTLATDAASIGIWDWDLKSDQWYASPTYSTMLGYDPHEGFLDRNIWFDRIHPDDQRAVGEEIRAVLAGSLAPYEYEARIRHADGSYRWVRVIGRVLAWDEQGKASHLIGVRLDITEHKRAEKQVEQLNRVYTVLSDVNQTIVRERNPQTILAAACRIAVEKGRFQMAWIGSVDAASGRIEITAHAGATDDTLTILRTLLGDHQRDCDCFLTLEALQTGHHSVCNDIAHDPRAASWRDAAEQRGYRAMASLPLKAAGQIAGTFNLYAGEPGFFDEEELLLLDQLALDIGFALDSHHRETERQRIDQSLRESEDRFRELAENIQEVFWMTDPAETQVLYISPAYEKIWGRTCASLYASPQSWMDAVHPDDRERLQDSVKARQGRGNYEETYRIVRPDDTVRWIHTRAFPVRGKTGELLRVVGTAEDVTESRQLEEQFRQSQKMESIGQLAGGVAHDFNNILAAIMMQADIAAAETTPPEETRELLDEIKAATARAANLTRQLLAFSSRQVILPRDLELNEVVTSLTKMLQRVVGEDVRLQLNLHPHALMTRADAGMLDQVLLNLVVNARDAMPHGGLLSIETSEQLLTKQEAASMPTATAGRRFACLRVTDTGTGITPENVSRIFEPFFTTKDPGKGTGLGLATVFGIIKQHGGSIRVETEVGRGTTFQILLPATEDAVQSPGVAAKPDSLSGTETILLAEDDPSLRVLTRVVLERAGYSVLEASDGVQALRIWEEHHDSIRLLFTDIVMPGGVSGHDLASRLRARRPDLRVVFASGYSVDIAGRELSMQAGQNFIQKPFSPKQLLETIRRCLDG